MKTKYYVSIVASCLCATLLVQTANAAERARSRNVNTGAGEAVAIYYPDEKASPNAGILGLNCDDNGCKDARYQAKSQTQSYGQTGQTRSSKSGAKQDYIPGAYTTGGHTYNYESSSMGDIATSYANILLTRTDALAEMANYIGVHDKKVAKNLKKMGKLSKKKLLSSNGKLATRVINKYGKNANQVIDKIVPGLADYESGMHTPISETASADLARIFAKYDDTVKIESEKITPTLAGQALQNDRLIDLYFHAESAFDFDQIFRTIALNRRIELDADHEKQLDVIPPLAEGAVKARADRNPFVSSSEYNFGFIFEEIRAEQHEALKGFAKALGYQKAFAETTEIDQLAADNLGLNEPAAGYYDYSITSDFYNQLTLLKRASETSSLSNESKAEFRDALVRYSNAVQREANEVPKNLIVAQRSMDYSMDTLSVINDISSGDIASYISAGIRLITMAGRAAADVENAKAGRRLFRAAQFNVYFYDMWLAKARDLDIEVSDLPSIIMKSADSGTAQRSARRTADATY